MHKYLYANANPVMFSDPTGYFSLAEFSVAGAISQTLDKIYTSNMLGIAMGMLNSLLVQLSGGTQEEVQAAFLKGFASGFLMGGGYAAISQLAQYSVFVRIALTAVDCWSTLALLFEWSDRKGWCIKTTIRFLDSEWNIVYHTLIM